MSQVKGPEGRSLAKALQLVPQEQITLYYGQTLESLACLGVLDFSNTLLRVFLDIVALTFPHVEKAKASENLQGKPIPLKNL